MKPTILALVSLLSIAFCQTVHGDCSHNLDAAEAAKPVARDVTATDARQPAAQGNAKRLPFVLRDGRIRADPAPRTEALTPEKHKELRESLKNFRGSFKKAFAASQQDPSSFPWYRSADDFRIFFYKQTSVWDHAQRFADDPKAGIHDMAMELMEDLQLFEEMYTAKVPVFTPGLMGMCGIVHTDLMLRPALNDGLDYYGMPEIKRALEEKIAKIQEMTLAVAPNIEEGSKETDFDMSDAGDEDKRRMQEVDDFFQVHWPQFRTGNVCKPDFSMVQSDSENISFYKKSLYPFLTQLTRDCPDDERQE